MKTSDRWHACARLASIFGAGLVLAIVVFFVKAGSSPHVSIVHAASSLPDCGGSAIPCMLGPNLEVVSIEGSIFSGTGPCVGGTTLFSGSPTDLPRFSQPFIAGVSRQVCGRVYLAAVVVGAVGMPKARSIGKGAAFGSRPRQAEAPLVRLSRHKI